MKIVVIGGSGLIGSKVVSRLKAEGHEVVAASPKSGVNSVTGEGLAQALEGASVMVDVSNSASFDPEPVMAFFRASTTNLIAAAKAAGVGHYVALSVVGTDRLLSSGYFRAKMVQETMIKASSIPYSIVRATQFFEFANSILEFSTVGDSIRVAPILIQPMAAADVSQAVGDVALGMPLNGMVEVGGPRAFPMAELVRITLNHRHETREIVIDPKMGYFGAEASERSIVPDGGARLSAMSYEDWLSQQQAVAAAR
ncbi:SDR family oxidoreductase [Paludibaculum fermentans]|uniref:SDR family oxidoreductase n=1 Tax=Paludibaculum fermentans TaxID=1473598 RepID=UPI003EBF242A